jgi:hypothetical protein
MRRLFFCLAAAAALLGSAAPADAANPDFVHATTNGDRYRPQVVVEYSTPVTVTDPAAQILIHRAGSATPVDFTLNGSGTTSLTIQVTGSLAAAQTYLASVQPDGHAADTVSWKTRAQPRYPRLRVKVVTALEPDAVDDLVRRLDRANLTAVPRPADVVDIAADTGRPLTAADLDRYRVAYVVTDQDVTGQPGAAALLAAFAHKGNGVVLGGQTHWTSGGLAWTSASALGDLTSTWATEWSPFEYTDPAAVEGGTLQAGSVVSHFITHGLTSLRVYTAGSGREYVHQSWTAQSLAKLQPTAAYPTGQALLGVHWETSDHPGRIVDLGFNPWSTAVPSGGGGFDPSQPDGAQAAPLIARALWWATDRIPPVGTRFTSKPPRVYRYATVLFTLTATDPDKSSPFAVLRYQYRVNRGRWRWATGGSSFALYHLPGGRTYVVQARAVDFAGNIDPHPAAYAFRLTPGASG